MNLPKPGLIGLAIRVLLAAAVLYLGITTLLDAPAFFDGIDEPAQTLPMLAILFFFWRIVVTELVQRPWGWWPSIITLAGLALAAGLGAVNGDPFGPAYGIYLWAWTQAFAFLLGPALLLATLLRTPGCEMRSYPHLWRRLRGADVDGVACPGWVDRFDHVRLFGRW